jgi:hypothetical protein
MIVDHEELMKWAQTQVRWEHCDANSIPLRPRPVRLEIAPEYSSYGNAVVVARVYLAEPRCLFRGTNHHADRLAFGCDCSPLAERRLS